MLISIKLFIVEGVELYVINVLNSGYYGIYVCNLLVIIKFEEKNFWGCFNFLELEKKDLR